MRDAALLASKFFKELAEVFDGQGKYFCPRKISLLAARPKFFSRAKRISQQKMAGENFCRENLYLHKNRGFNQLINIESSKKQKLNDSSANMNGGSDVGQKHSSKSNGNGGSATDAKDSEKKKDKKKKSKKAKDDVADQSGVSAIKKPLSAYMLFNNARRPTL